MSSAAGPTALVAVMARGKFPWSLVATGAASASRVLRGPRRSRLRVACRNAGALSIQEPIRRPYRPGHQSLAGFTAAVHVSCDRESLPTE